MVVITSGGWGLGSCESLCRPTHQRERPQAMISTTTTRDSTTDFFDARLAERDPQIFQSVGRELRRQQDQIELIASENIVSRAVLEAQGSVLTNKYAEGYPGRRYYGGCEFVDEAEAVAIDRAKKLFAC